MMPCTRIDSASSSRACSLKSVLGWKGLTSIAETGISLMAPLMVAPEPLISFFHLNLRVELQALFPIQSSFSTSYPPSLPFSIYAVTSLRCIISRARFRYAREPLLSASCAIAGAPKLGASLSLMFLGINVSNTIDLKCVLTSSTT